MSLQEIDLSAPIRPIEWLVDGLIPLGLLTTVASLPGVGKTTLLAALMWEMCPEEGLGAFLDSPVQPGHALYVNYDAPTGDGRTLRTVLDQLAVASPRRHDHIHILEPGEDSHSLTPEDVADIGQRALACGARLIVFDSFMACFPGLDGNKMQDVLSPLSHLRQLAVETGAAVVILDHHPKPAAGEKPGARGPIGSVAKSAQPRAVFSLQALDPETTEGRQLVKVTCTKQTFAQPPHPFVVEFIRQEGGLVLARGEVSEALQETRIARAQALMRGALQQAAGGWVTRKELTQLAQEEAHLRPSAAKLALDRLLSVLGVEAEAQTLSGPGSPKAYRWQPAVAVAAD